MTPQEKLQNRLYELLPHKKELAFGCAIKLYDDESNTPIGRYISEITLINAPGNRGIEAEIFGNTCVQHFPLDEFHQWYKVIGQQLHLADLLLAIESRVKITGDEYDWFKTGGVMVSSQGTIYTQELDNSFNRSQDIVSEYNLQDDNILNQSDDFCEWAYELIK